MARRCEKSDLDLDLAGGKGKKKGERDKGEGSNLGVVESCSRNLIPNTKKANFNEIQEIVYGSI